MLCNSLSLSPRNLGKEALCCHTPLWMKVVCNPPIHLCCSRRHCQLPSVQTPPSWPCFCSCLCARVHPTKTSGWGAGGCVWKHACRLFLGAKWWCQHLTAHLSRLQFWLYWLEGTPPQYMWLCSFLCLVLQEGEAKPHTSTEMSLREGVHLLYCPVCHEGTPPP